jgi:hypothetical protein
VAGLVLNLARVPEPLTPNDVGPPDQIVGITGATWREDAEAEVILSGLHRVRTMAGAPTGSSAREVRAALLQIALAPPDALRSMLQAAHSATRAQVRTQLLAAGVATEIDAAPHEAVRIAATEAAKLLRHSAGRPAKGYLRYLAQWSEELWRYLHRGADIPAMPSSFAAALLLYVERTPTVDQRNVRRVMREVRGPGLASRRRDKERDD